MTDIHLTLIPLRSGLLAGHDSTATVLIRVRAPVASRLENRTRRPLNLALVIDRSGSMAGRPLAEARRCAEFVVNALAPTDQASIVTYSDRVDVLAPSQSVGDRRRLLAAIRSITQGGSTALFDGWQLGADQALFGHSPEGLTRVLLLSDGQANVGLRDAEQIAPRVAHAARQGVSTSTYGLGHHFNEHLMMSMAKAGQGNGYYGESAEDLMDPFREELELLNDLCARRLDLSLEAPAGVRISLLNDYEQLSPGRWRLPDLAHGSEAWALAEIRIPAEVARSRGVNEIEILRAALDFEPLDGGRHHAKPARLVLPFMPAWDFDALDINETVSARLQEIRAADIQVRASRAARHQQWDVVDQLLATARSECANNPWLLESLDSLTRYATRRDTECFSKEAAFKSQKLKSRLVDPNESVRSYSIAEQADSSSYLRRKPEQGKRLL